MDIKRTKELLGDVSAIASSVIYMVRHGMDAGAFFRMTTLVSAVAEAMQDAPAAWPEMKDLTEAEAAQLGAEAYKAAKVIYDAVKA